MDPSVDSPKLPDMVMCGDHPSITKTELNEKEPAEDKEAPTALPRSKPSASSFPERAAVRASVRALRVRRRGRGLGEAGAGAGARAHSGALIQAALGSFRWPPYLVGVWVCVLLLTHILHCVVGCLERALPRLRAFCQYLRSAAERGWHSGGGPRLGPAALGTLAAAGYALYCALYVVYSLALWSIEPLAEELQPDSATKVTDYTDASDDSSK